MLKRTPMLPVLAAIVLLTACDGPQSTLVPAGRAAERIAGLWWWMAGGATVVWISVVGLAVYAIRVDPGPHDPRRTKWLVLGGGALVPTVILAVLLLQGLRLIPDLLAPGTGEARIHVTGEEWWWRVRYQTADGDTVELANEIRLPVGQRTEIALASADVIHSFWVPSLGGKIDMIPGRGTRMTLEPTRTGIFRGVCAEYCGRSHARMNFIAVVMEPDAFDAWLEAQNRPAPSPATPGEVRGRELFLANGCGACHTVRGTAADGRVGPDLTHLGSRRTLGAGLLAMERSSLERWISHPGEMKPGVHMPAFGMLPVEDVRAMATWLAGLR